MEGVKIIDITALAALVEIKINCKSKSIKQSFVNIDSKIEIRMAVANLDEVTKNFE